MPNVNEVWGGAPVQRVNSLQDLNKLVASAPVGSVEVRAEHAKPGRTNGVPNLRPAAEYAIANPHLAAKEVAEKFNVNVGSLYAAVFRLKNDGKRTKEPVLQSKRVLTAEQKETLRQRAAAARATLAEKRARGEVTYPKRKKVEKQWVHNSVSTSAAPVKEDVVNHPSHYKQGGIETIDFIEAKQLTYNLGNVVKYITRAGIKNKATHIEDLEKAAWYLNREIANLKK